jgi:hypothetical protein
MLLYQIINNAASTRDTMQSGRSHSIDYDA